MPKAKPKKRHQPNAKVAAAREKREVMIQKVLDKQDKKPPKAIVLTTQALINVRNAYKNGKKKITLSGIEFKIRRSGRFLIVRPTKQRFPVANVQIESGPSPKLQEWARKPVEPR